MPMREMYVVMTRHRGLFLVEYQPGKGQGEAIEEALGLKGGYSAGRLPLELAEGAAEAWVAWVELTLPNGQPYFEFRTFDADLTEDEVTALCQEANEEPLKLNKSEIYGPEHRVDLAPPAFDDEHQQNF